MSCDGSEDRRRSVSVELEKLGGKCALERGSDEPPETQFDRDVKFLENQKKQRRSEGLRLQSVNAAAEELQDKELQRVMDTFNTFDADGSGAIDVDELGVTEGSVCPAEEQEGTGRPHGGHGRRRDGRH